jgi:glycosyl transferase family 25
MRVLLINLDRCPDRLHWSWQGFFGLGIRVERVRAVDGTALGDDERSAFSAARPLRGVWHAGQIGCFQSHLRAWQEIAAGEEDAAAVFEDDMHLSAGIVPFLEGAAWIPSAADIVRLETSKQGMLLGHCNVVFDRCLRPVLSEAWGAGAYVITKSAARRLVSVPVDQHLPVDWFLFNKAASVAARSLAVFQVVPAPSIQNRLLTREPLFQSTIIDDFSVHRRTALAYVRKAVNFIRGRRRVAFR